MADNGGYSQLAMRVTDDERRLIEEEADREHLSLASLMRSIVLKEIVSRRTEREQDARAAA